jgi:hypothetical protein
VEGDQEGRRTFGWLSGGVLFYVYYAYMDLVREKRHLCYIEWQRGFVRGVSQVCHKGNEVFLQYSCDLTNLSLASSLCRSMLGFEGCN